MKPILWLLLGIFLCGTAFPQQNEGAIKTKNGFILYFNDGRNSHTLNLEGEVDISNFPFIKLNNDWFQFYTEEKAAFGTEKKDILNKYMNWEFEYYKEQLQVNLEIANVFIAENGLLVNFWQFNNPTSSRTDSKLPVKATYFADFVHNDLIFRFTYASTSGSDLEAKNILLNLVNNIRFYNHEIDLIKLQEQIYKGINFYNY